MTGCGAPPPRGAGSPDESSRRTVFATTWVVYTKRQHQVMLEWDETKRLVNIQRRGLDFGDADLMFDGRPVTTAASRRNNEDRFISTAEINGKLYTVVWMWRRENQRIISFRRAGNAEERAYRQVFG